MIHAQKTSVIATLGFALVAQLLLPSTSMASEVQVQVEGTDTKAALTVCLDTDLEALPALMSKLGEPAVASGFELLTAPPPRPSGNAWLTSDEVRAIIEGLSAQPSALRRYLDLNVASEGGLDQRARGLEALEPVASDADFKLLTALASPTGPAAASQLLDERLRTTVLSSLRAGRWTHDVMSDHWSELSPGARRAFTSALGDTDHPAGIETLAALLARRVKADQRLVLEAVEQVAKRHQVLGGPDTQVFILDLLKSPDQKLRRSAIRAAAALRLEGAVPELVEFARDSEADRKPAIDALRTITDVQLPYDVDRWAQWLQEEEKWRAEQLRKLDVSLASRSPAVLHQSLRELGDHRWGRRDTVAQLRPLLTHRDPTIRAATAACLGRLKCPSSIADLLDLLEDVEPVAAAAHTALQAVTDKRLPRGSSDWTSVAVLPVLLD